MINELSEKVKAAKNFLEAAGLRDGKIVARHTKFRKRKYIFDGYALDELYIAAKMTDQDSVQELIDMLQITKYCFPKNENTLEQNITSR